MPDARVFGIVTGAEANAQVVWLEKTIPVTPELLAKTGDVEPQRIFRIVVKCQENACVHFDGSRCQLAQRIVDHLKPTVEELPLCSIRPTCRWFAEHKRVACFRCPQISTHTYDPPAVFKTTAGGSMKYESSSPMTQS